MADRWDHLARLLALHEEACVALAMLREQRGDGAGGMLGKVAVRERHVARLLEAMARTRDAPRELRVAARRHVESVRALLG